MAKLHLSVELRGSEPVILVADEADLTSAGELRDLLVSRTWMIGRRLTIDASGLSFIDSWAMRVPVVTAKRLRDRGGELVLFHPQEPVMRVIVAVLFQWDDPPGPQSARPVTSEVLLVSGPGREDLEDVRQAGRLPSWGSRLRSAPGCGRRK